MRERLNLQVKDSQRLFGALERELIYYRDKKSCAVCDSEVLWPESEIHHIEEHSKGGLTSLDNGALVHKRCHPKSASDVKALAQKLKERVNYAPEAQNASPEAGDEEDDADAA
jgi:hypothetical protein